MAEGEDENDWNKRGGKLHRDTVKDAKKGKAAAGAGRVLRGRKAAEARDERRRAPPRREARRQVAVGL